MVHLIRLVPSISSGWVLYPAFEERVVKANQEYLPESTPQQTAAMTQILRQRWVNEPASAGYWLALRDNEPIGHVCGWMAMDWSQPYAFIYQAVTMFESGLTDRWMDELEDWVAEMNGLLTARGNPTITFVEFSTFNNAEAMTRLLGMRGRENIRHRSVMRFDI